MFQTNRKRKNELSTFEIINWPYSPSNDILLKKTHKFKFIFLRRFYRTYGIDLRVQGRWTLRFTVLPLKNSQNLSRYIIENANLTEIKNEKGAYSLLYCSWKEPLGSDIHNKGHVTSKNTSVDDIIGWIALISKTYRRGRTLSGRELTEGIK